MTANSNKVGAHGEKAVSFEESFARLQEVVGRLSAGNLSLQDALAAFEEGMLLADRCSQMLDEAELRVKQVSERAMRAGSLSLVELDEEIRGGLSSTKSGDPFLVEIESYEATIVQGSGGGKQAPLDKDKPQSTRAYPQPLLNELDPLFDEDE